MAKFIKKRFPALFVATYFIVAVSMVGYLIYPAIFGQASVAADFTNNGAATATWGPSYTDQLVLDVTIPDAWNGVAYTADILYWDAGTVDNWQGDTLNAFPALGTITGVGYVEDLVDVGFQTTESVVADLDADSVMTLQADILIDGDGSGSVAAGTVDPAAAGGDPILAMGNDAGHGGLAICADSLFYWVLTAIRIDTNGDCTDGTQTEGTYIIGTNATAAATETNGTWAFGDAVTMGGNGDGDYDDGEDIFYENNLFELTYSAEADGLYLAAALVGATISNFPADCDGGGVGTQACMYTGTAPFDINDNIYIDDGTAGGAAPNSEVDRQDDLLVGLGVQNTGTAVDITDIGIVEVWADAGAAGFQGFGVDTTLGTMTVNSGDTKEWRLGGLVQSVAATVGQRIFVTVDLPVAPTNGRTLKFQIPVYNDAGADGVATSDNDRGVFMGSNNDGPTDAVILNAFTQTIDSQPPSITSRVTTDNDNDGKIDRIIFTTNENLDDDFSALTITVDGYIVESYDTGGSANDNIFWVIFTEGLSFDTGVTPDIQITVNTSLGDAYGNDIAVDGAPVAATDGAIPTIGTVIYKDEDGDGKIDRIMLTYTETVTGDSVVSANDLAFDNVGSFTDAAFGGNASDLVTGAVSFTNINLGIEASVIATYDATSLLAISTQNAFSLTDGTNTTLLWGSQTQVTFADGAGPVLGGAGGTGAYLDNNSDGMIDTLQTWWSENVIMSGSTAVDWTIIGGSMNAVFASAADDAGGDPVIYVAVTADPNVTGSAVAPTVAYDNDDANNSVTDTALNPSGTTGPQTLVDGAPPRPVSAAYKDSNGDGTVERIDITMTAEASLSCVFNVGNWSISTPGDITVATPSACAVSGNDIQVTVSADANETGGTTDPTILFTNATPKGSVLDAGGLNQAPTFTAPVTATDGAAPVIVTTFPASAATGVALDASMVITFSEAMTTASVTGEISRTPTFTLGTAGWTSGDTVLTYASHDAWAGLQLYTITLSGNIASAATTDGNLGAGPVANPFDFTTVAATSGGGGGGGGLPASVTVTTPNGGEVWAGLSSKNITWSSTSTTISKAKLYYSLDRGVNFPYTIATNENNDGTYSWTVPNIPSGTVKVKVEGYDESGAFVASDISDADFTITYTTPSPAGEEIPSAENPAGLVAGDLLKSPLSTTVYYFGSDNKRHIFPNEKTYKSWYPDWSNVKSVTAEELRAIPLGKNVTVRVGTVLVKIDTNPKVYAVEPGGLLRWVPTEARAVTLYGSAWATKIIDVPLAFWGDYSFGTDISTDTHPTGALVQYTGTTNKYYIQGAEKRLISTAGFTANNFRNEYVLPVPTTLYYAPGADITAAENAISWIY